MHTSKLISLAAVRAALELRFPEAAVPPVRFWDMAWEPLDEQKEAIALGAVAELCGRAACGRLFLDRVLWTLPRRGEWAGLIEVGRSLDPQSYPGRGLERVLHVCCATTEQAVKAADLLLRDGNLPLVLLDFQTAPVRSLSRIPANTWHRFQRLVERSGTALVVLTPQPMIEAARTRIVLRGRWSLPALHRPRAELLAQLEVQIFHRSRHVQLPTEPLVRTA